MLSSLKKLVALPAVVVTALTMSGCLKSDETITIYPDASGKIQMKSTLIGMFAQMAKMGQLGGPGGPGGMGGGNAPAERPDPYQMIKEGFGENVYWSNLSAEDGPQGEWIISGTGYFEDVNKLERNKEKMSFRKTETGDGFLFEMDSKVADQLRGKMGDDDPNKTPEQKQQQEMQKQMAKSMMAGFVARVTVVMPGAVKSAEGMTPGEGRQAVFALDEKELLEIIDGKRQPPKEMRVTSGAAEASIEAELATFKTELAKAKAAAEAEKAEKKAEAAKKAAEGKKKSTDGEKKPTDGQKKPAGGEKKPQDF